MYALILALALALTPQLAHAITLLPPCTATGDCGVTDVLGAGLNFAELLLGISGAVALLFFVWGGFQYVLAGIHMGDINKAKDTIKNAVIGIMVIFFAGVIVNFTSNALTGGKSAVHVVGQSCSAGGNSGLYVDVPGGFTDPNNPAQTVQPEKIECISDCKTLKMELQTRNRPDADTYGCYSADDPGVGSCVRGLCGAASASFACCSCPNGGCSGSP